MRPLRLSPSGSPDSSTRSENRWFRESWTDEQIASIPVPVLMIIGDTDLVQFDKALEMFRLLGGQSSTGPMGPALNTARQFAVIPGATHYDIVFKTDLMLPLIESFFAAQAS